MENNEQNTKQSQAYENIKDDPDYDLFGLVNMYTNTDYKRIDYEYGNIKFHINALQSASTDMDLTGQIVWQAADIFSHWITQNETGQQIF